jgi:hypothetical protein
LASFPLAVTSATRWEGLPDLPTLSDFVPGFEATSWYGVGAPRNTPTEIIEKLNKEINADLADPNLKARLAALGVSSIDSISKPAPRSNSACRSILIRVAAAMSFHRSCSSAADNGSCWNLAPLG